MDVMLAAVVVGVYDRLHCCQLKGNHCKPPQCTKSVSVHVLLVKLYSRAILRVPVTLAIENKAERLP